MRPAKQIRNQFDTEQRQFTIDFDMSYTDRQPGWEFKHSVIPYAVGYAESAGYGITNIGFVEKSITFTRVQDNE